MNLTCYECLKDISLTDADVARLALPIKQDGVHLCNEYVPAPMTLAQLRAIYLACRDNIAESE
jgi:hypothetical protein